MLNNWKTCDKADQRMQDCRKGSAESFLSNSGDRQSEVTDVQKARAINEAEVLTSGFIHGAKHHRLYR